MRILDLFCGGGGAAMGLHRAGFDVVGVDINRQPNYPFKFIKADIMDFDVVLFAEEFDAIWASPPCQAYSVGTTAPGAREKHPELVEPVREMLVDSGLPYIIENVPGAPLRDYIRLCGEMFGLRVIRHRHFETNFQLPEPKHIRHKPPVERAALDGTDRIVKRSWYMQVAGHGGESSSYKMKDWEKAMGIDWMTKAELVEAIPPVYSEYIGRNLLENLR